jgi:enoyl-CoA hydratase/carnithine racemase
MSTLVEMERREGVLEIVLKRPEKRNAINLEMLAQFDEAVARAVAEDGLRVVIIRGEGKVFSAGIDVTAFMQLSNKYGDQWRLRMRNVSDDFQRVLTRLERLEIPTIALLHGHCLGLALELALACDLRLAASDTWLGLPESRLGIIPDVGGTTRLTRLVGPARAKELIFTGRQIDAATALEWGIVNYVVPFEDLETKANELASEIQQAAPLAVGMAKRVVDGLSDMDRGLMLEAWAQSQLFSTEDFGEAVQAFIEKRPPNFKGR